MDIPSKKLSTYHISTAPMNQTFKQRNLDPSFSTTPRPKPRPQHDQNHIAIHSPAIKMKEKRLQRSQKTQAGLKSKPQLQDDCIMAVSRNLSPPFGGFLLRTLQKAPNGYALVIKFLTSPRQTIAVFCLSGAWRVCIFQMNLTFSITLLRNTNDDRR